MGKSAVVFGGAGFIGSHLLARLSVEGRYDQLVCADIQVPSDPVCGVSYQILDVRDPVQPERLGAADAVFNLAAIHRTPGHTDLEYYETNVLGAANITRYAAKAGTRILIFVSSIAVYGEGSAAFTEDSSPSPVSAYGRSKLLAEKLHAQWQQDQVGRSIVIARPGAVFGRGENGNFTRLAQALKKRFFLYPGRRDTIKACGDVDGLVRALLQMSDEGRDRLTFNYCYPEPVTITRICKAMCKEAGWPLPFGRLPGPVASAAGFCFEVLARAGVPSSINRARLRKLRQDTNVVPAVLMKAGFDFAGGLEPAIRRWYSSPPGGSFR